MNYLQQKPDSQAIKNKNNQGTSTQILQLFSNNQTIMLPQVLIDIIGVKVKSLSWSVDPTGITGSNLLFLSCDDLIENTVNQSQIISPSPFDPSGATQQANPKNIIASWVLSTLNTTLRYPNADTPNYDQSIIWFNRPQTLTKFKLVFETDQGQIGFDVNSKVNVVLEYYYHINTCDY
jgi:hypothetical protein